MIDQIEARIKRGLTMRHYNPETDLNNCLRDLLKQPVSDAQLDLVERYLTGDFVSNAPLSAAEDSALMGDSGWWPLISLLFDQNRLTYDLFKRSLWRAYRVAYLIGERRRGGNTLDQTWDRLYAFWRHQPVNEACLTVLRNYSETLAWEMALDFSEQARKVLRGLHFIAGSRYLLLVAQYHLQHLGGRPRLDDPHNDVAWVLIHILRSGQLEPLSEADKAQLVSKLQEFPSATLQAMLPFAYETQPILCDALGWQRGLELLTFIRDLSFQSYNQETDDYAHRDIPNSPDPACGVVDLAEAQRVIDEAGQELAFEIFDTIRQSGETSHNALTLVEAVTGRNRAKLETGIKKHSQVAIKAYGLLPLAPNETIIQRYLTLKWSAKEGQKFGQQRRATHSAAVQAALRNLAQRGGYSDVNRMEWTLEAQLADEIAPPGQTWHVNGYDLRLDVEGTEISLAFSRNGKILKSVPAAVKVSDDYKKAADIVQQLRSQVSRLRSGLLERLMATGEPLSCEDFQMIQRLPVARDLFQRMIWQTNADIMGLFDAAQMALIDLQGQTHPIGQSVILAHPYDLFEAGSLADWQRQIVHQRIIQPIKQAFRELYVLTPAEQETRTYSNRFAGQMIDTRVASRLLGSRGWQIERDTGRFYKVFGGLRAVFGYEGDMFYRGGEDRAPTERLYFEPYPNPSREWVQDPSARGVPLDQIPPRVFSEVMRDADLVVSVAHREIDRTAAAVPGIQNYHLSNEVYERRGNVITTLINDLGLPGVTIEGHFAHIQGKLARYRVHLASGAIHIEPGHYLCIVPARWGQKHEKLFLPFVDESDSKISEVISKILLLLADDKIKDESILRQIGPRN